MTRLKGAVQSAIRGLHVIALDRGLPRKAGVYLHSIRPEEYEAFRELSTFFRGAGYRFAGPDDFLEDPEENCVFLSFDDNYQAWYDALDLLDESGVEATFYVNTCAIRERSSAADIGSYYDRLGYDGPRQPLSSTEIKAIADAGHTVGSHTHSHRKLTAMSFDDAVTDIATGKAELEAILGAPVCHFAYPYGMRRHFDERLRSACQSLGFRTIANARPGMQHAVQASSSLHRSVWRLESPLEDNVQNLRIDGRIIDAITGRSAIA